MYKYLSIPFLILVLACASGKEPVQFDPNEISDVDWVLVELQGQTFPDAGEQGPFIRFQASDSMVTGFGGCNRFFGKFEIKGPLQIRFSRMGTTMMACPNLTLENEFMRMLERVNNYTLSNDILNLNVGRAAPLARFKRKI